MLNLPTFGQDGSSEGHIEGTTLDKTTTNQNWTPLQCEVRSGALKCQSAANHIDPVKTSVMRILLDTTTKGKNGADQFVFVPTSLVGAVGVRVLPAAACGPNYS